MDEDGGARRFELTLLKSAACVSLGEIEKPDWGGGGNSAGG